MPLPSMKNDGKGQRCLARPKFATDEIRLLAPLEGAESDKGRVGFAAWTLRTALQLTRFSAMGRNQAFLG